MAKTRLVATSTSVSGPTERLVDDESTNESTVSESSATKDCDETNASSSESGEDANEGEEVDRARGARRKARKRAKRERVKILLARKRSVQREKAAEQQRMSDERLAERQRVADEAVKELEERKLRRARDEAEGRVRQQGKPARVSLVQHRGEEVEQRTLDSGARYTVAGTEWMQYGDRVERAAPVDYLEGIGGFLLDVMGVWEFHMRSVFGEIIRVEACIVSGCTDEFLLGVDFMRGHGAIMDFDRNEVRYTTARRAVVIPFRTSGDANGARVAAVRMVRRTEIGASAVTPVEVSVAANDGEVGVFLPTKYTGAVMLAVTVTKVQNGKAIVPAVNAKQGPVRLPARQELGHWIPLDSSVELLQMNGELRRERINEWVNGLGGSNEPL
ncbi:hypothetical protein PHYSODRAFT_500434 [Phytophthora sojae]|uniref:Uncharacterized protein n=1 Tax=Phytophthora sojae (strain P6497) TaxID=1094619 RepID=G4ZID3_PHYSP|nr:hypothetical protein PHYSODRAFT_500434 [Phytophthora sojae]EGZ16797.1 hypothetical protein PHYSODRAFT_500434 [Phytophthora sojae]|eukprot:XP_009525855.1 hypothetical protein PHYSODRAFT_500434 [Phytophthora sojae]